MPLRNRTRTVRTLIATVVAAMLVVAMVATPAGANDKSEQHCRVTVLGQGDRGGFVLSPVDCSGAHGLTLFSVVAVHYTGTNFSGSSLSIEGGACNGGWLNLPSGWTNVVSSTWSACTTSHYDLYNLQGSVEVLGAPGGNLSSLNDKTNSVRYT